jgi:hypothetical protein
MGVPSNWDSSALQILPIAMLGYGSLTFLCPLSMGCKQKPAPQEFLWNSRHIQRWQSGSIRWPKEGSSVIKFNKFYCQFECPSFR